MLLTLAALAVPAWLPSMASAGPPGPGDASAAIAAKICMQVQHDLGSAGFRRVFRTTHACEQIAKPTSAAAVRMCLVKNQPGTDGWRRCIEAHVAAAAKSLEAKRR